MQSCVHLPLWIRTHLIGSVLFFCFSNFTPVKLPFEETHDNIETPNVKYYIYKEVGCCTFHGKIPLGVTYWCYLC